MELAKLLHGVAGEWGVMAYCARGAAAAAAAAAAHATKGPL